MPAIQPARLKKQVSDLVNHFHQPGVFVRELHALLEFYSDHTHHKTHVNQPSPLVKAYNAPLPVMRQVWLELNPLIKQYPAEVLPLYDALWIEPFYDLQLLAARLLGQAEFTSSAPIIDRLQTWVNKGMEKQIMDELFEVGLIGLRKSAPDKLLDLVSNWLESPDELTRRAGLRALCTLIDQSGTEYLPTIYRLLTPFLRIAPSRLRPDILAVLSALIICSPSETAFLLRQNLSTPDNPDIAWIIRQVMNEFPEAARNGLRQALRENA